MNPVTQPMTTAEMKRLLAFANRGLPERLSVDNSQWQSVYRVEDGTHYANEPVINPVEIDWLKINEEFSR
jgi:hypothetical protein